MPFNFSPPPPSPVITVDKYLALIVPEHNSGIIVVPVPPILAMLKIVEGFDSVTGTISATSPIVGPHTTLLHFDDTPGSTTFVDVYGNNFTQLDAHFTTSAANPKFGTASGAVSGSAGAGSACSFNPLSSVFSFGVGDFTISFWVYSNHASDGLFSLTDIFGSQTIHALSMYLSAGVLHVKSGTTDYNTGASIPTGTWTCISMTRITGTSTVRVNGITALAFADSTLYRSISGSVIIGADATLTFLLNDGGYIDEFAINNNTGLYTADYTPENVPFPN